MLQSSPPYLRELILFALNTGLRCGDLFDLKWEEVDIDEKRISLIIGKTRRRLDVPLNETALAILCGKRAIQHGPHVFYNPVTGDRFYDLKGGFNRSSDERTSRESLGILCATVSPRALHAAVLSW